MPLVLPCVNWKEPDISCAIRDAIKVGGSQIPSMSSMNSPSQICPSRIWLHQIRKTRIWYDTASMKELDGGQLDMPEISRMKAVLQICDDNDLDSTSLRHAPLSMIETLQEAAYQQMQAEASQMAASSQLPEAQEQALDEYPMPDEQVSTPDMQEYGYSYDGMLPVTRERALELDAAGLTVYVLHEDNTESMVFDPQEIMEHGGLFGVDREEWEKSPQFHEKVMERQEHQQEREQAFLSQNRDCFAIYQVKHTDELRDIRYEGMDWLRSIGQAVKRENYDLVYTAPLEPCNSPQATVEQIYNQFNNDHPADYHHPSMSVSDIVAIKQDGNMNKYIVEPLGSMYLSDVTADDIRLALIPLTTKSAGLYSTVNMLLKCVFYSAERSQLLDYNPCEGISAKGGKQAKKKDALTDEQTKLLLDTVKELPPYTFIMIALYSGLRREEILGLQWDCVFLDTPAPYISVRRAWRTEHNRPVISTTLKTKAARRDVPIPKCLVDRLREVKEESISEYVIADSEGQPLSASQFQRVWKYVTVRTAKPRNYYKYVNGQSIKYTVTPTLGGHQKNNPKLVYAIDFDVTPHQLRHTYITNLLYAGVDPKTVQYLAGHENSKTTMDIYAQVKYNKPEELCSVVNGAFQRQSSK